ncbi:MAG: esterase/lipase/thioesterase family protein [Achromobacter mucicolens]|nr:esterase/lipase/thioesterase family protein [Achromobacter mucicolens]TQJ96444.1 hypothetical protein FBY20_3223 [Achromobacter sp. SLBN-14]CAB3899114.1 hypothetical protein LMG26686_04396 [Achromobacter mucicolens]
MSSWIAAGPRGLLAIVAVAALALGLLAACSPLTLLSGAVPEDGSDVTAGLAYGTLPRQHLDVYRPTDATGAPVVVFFYGGGWRSGLSGHARRLPTHPSRQPRRATWPAADGRRRHHGRPAPQQRRPGGRLAGGGGVRAAGAVPRPGSQAAGGRAVAAAALACARARRRQRVRQPSVPIRRRRVTVRSLAAATPLAARCD